jgi:hypothetical protein
MKQRRTLIALILVMFTLVEAYSQEPFIGVAAGSDTLYWYTGMPVEIPIIAGPAGGTVTVSDNATLTPIYPEAGRYRATISNPETGYNEVCVTVEQQGRKASQCMWVVVEQPEMSTGIDRWPGMRAMIGRKYNPSSEWKSLAIPAAHYQTVVEIDGRIVFDRPGTSFREGALPYEMVVTENMKNIRTTVYWKPNGTFDRAEWMPLVTNSDPSSRRRFEIAYPVPEQTEGFEFDWRITPRSMRADFGPIVLKQSIGQGRHIGVEAAASCDECVESGILPRLIQSDDVTWQLAMNVDLVRLKSVSNGKQFDVALMLQGRGGTSGFGVVKVTVWVDPAMFGAGGDASGDSLAGGDRLNEKESSAEPTPGELIQSLKPFKGKKIAIFRIEGAQLLGTMLRHMEAEDKVDVDRVQEMCEVITDEPLADCFNTILQLASSERTNSGQNYQAFKLLMSQRYGLDPDDIDDGELMKMLSIVLAVKARREVRPSGFYLVTSEGKRPEIIGLVSTGGGLAIKQTYTGRALTEELKRFGSLAKELPQMLPSAMDDQESALVRVWPEDKVRDH